MTTHMVSTSMFDSSFAALDHDAQLVECYLRLCPHRATEGLSRIPAQYIAADLGMDEERVTKALRTLTERRRFMYDFERGIVLDLDALPTNPLGEKDKRLQGAIKRLRGLEKSPLLKALYNVATDCSPWFSEAMLEAFPNVSKPLEEPLTKPLGMDPPKPRDETRRNEAETEIETGSGLQLDPSTRAREGVWLHGQKVVPCVVCGNPCHSQDPEGNRRHGPCEMSPGLRVVEEVSF